MDGMGHSDISTSTEYWLILVATPVIVTIGLVGNCLSVIVMLRERFRGNTISLFFIALALADSAYLLVNYLTNMFVKILSGFDIRDSSEFLCKATLYLLYVSKAFASWVIVAVSVERLMLVAIPLKAKVLFTITRVRVLIICLLLSNLILYLYIPILYSIQHENINPGCNFSDDLWKLNRNLNMLDMVIYSIIPSCLILVSNSVLYYSLKYRTYQHTTTDGESHPTFTTTLVIVSLAHIFLTLPLSIFLVYETNIHPRQKSDSLGELYIGLYVLCVSNNAVNFILYCLSGTTFRSELKVIFTNVCCILKNIKIQPVSDNPSPKPTTEVIATH